MWETEDDGKITPVSAERRPGRGTRGTERESVPHVTLARDAGLFLLWDPKSWNARGGREPPSPLDKETESQGTKGQVHSQPPRGHPGLEVSSPGSFLCTTMHTERPPQGPRAQERTRRNRGLP